MASSAAGVPEPIAFRVEGGPVDWVEEPAVLTLPEVVRIAVCADPGIQAALARVRIAMADAKQARLLPNPILRLALRIPEGGGTPVIEASLAEDLIAFLTIPRRSSAADHRVRQASAAAVRAAIDLVAAVQEVYVSAQATEELLPLLEQRMEVLGRVLDLAKRRLAAGEGVRDDVTVLETQRVELEVELSDLRRDLRDERIRLARLIGRPSGDAGWQIVPWEVPVLADVPEAEWIDAALRSRPEIQEQVWHLAALGDDYALARLLAFDGSAAEAQLQRDGDWQAGPEIAIPVPIFDAGRTRAERVNAEQIEARHQLVEAQRQVIEDVRRALESLNQTRANAVRVRRELLPLQEQRVVQAEAAFGAGQSDITSRFLAERGLQAVQARLVELEHKAAVAAIRLQRAAGGPGPAGEVARGMRRVPGSDLPARK